MTTRVAEGATGAVEIMFGARLAAALDRWQEGILFGLSHDAGLALAQRLALFTKP